MSKLLFVVIGCSLWSFFGSWLMVEWADRANERRQKRKLREHTIRMSRPLTDKSFVKPSEVSGISS